jgi:hypothetical protein
MPQRLRHGYAAGFLHGLPRGDIELNGGRLVKFFRSEDFSEAVGTGSSELAGLELHDKLLVSGAGGSRVDPVQAEDGRVQATTSEAPASNPNSTASESPGTTMATMGSERVCRSARIWRIASMAEIPITATDTVPEANTVAASSIDATLITSNSASASVASIPSRN